MPTRSSTKARSADKAPARRTKRSRSARQVLDEQSRHEIIGILVAALAVALGISVYASAGGPVPNAVATGLRTAFGVGAYAIPVLVVFWAASFFLEAPRIDAVRIGIGLGLLLVSVLGIVAIGNAPATEWDQSTVVATGGYVGAALAWALRSLLGVPIAYVAASALALIGLITAGLSVSEVLDGMKGLFSRRSEPEAEASSRETPPRRRAAKTVPLEDLEQPTLELHAGAGLAQERARPRTAEVDRQARKATRPGTASIAPRALEGFKLPPVGMLTRTPESASAHRASEKELRHTANVIEQTFATFDIPARVVDWIAGPTVTMFETEIARGVKVTRVTALSDDLALALAAPTIRILAPIPGKSYVGVEVPNIRRATVTLGDVLHSGLIADPRPLMLAIGKDVAGENVSADLAAMPHLLIAGSTGSGKSVCVNSLIMSILMRATPAEVRMILVDPKRIELILYNGVPHLYVPVVTEAKEAASALHWAVGEMEGRLKKLQKAGVRNIAQYNAAIRDGKAADGQAELPYLVIVIDELADLMMIAAKEVEDSICRIAQLGRAAGIHLIVATQRPSTDIITGLIKANITNRIAFAVSSGIDSRVILDQPGAEKLVGLGDMLFSTPAWPKPRRIQGAYVSEDEINEVVAHLKAQAEPEYHEEILHLKVSGPGAARDEGQEEDPLLWEAADIVVTSGVGSTSLLQRRLKVGYARAGRIMDTLEAKGIVGRPDGSKPREVLVDVEDLEALKHLEDQERDDDDG